MAESSQRVSGDPVQTGTGADSAQAEPGLLAVLRLATEPLSPVTPQLSWHVSGGLSSPIFHRKELHSAYQIHTTPQFFSSRVLM